MPKNASRKARRHHAAPGSPPGVLTVDPEARETKLSAMWITADSVETSNAPDLTRLKPPAQGVLWLNVDGLGNAETLKAVADAFDLHPLAMEDVTHLNQRPKIEDYEKHHFIVLRMPNPGTPFSFEQVSLFVGANFVLTLQEYQGDVFQAVRQRLNNPQSLMRTRGADYLAYALIDAVTDSYFPLLEAFGDQLEELEDDVILGTGPNPMEAIHEAKQQLNGLRASVWPMRDLLSAALRNEGVLFSDPTRVYLRDCHDHTFQQIEMIQTYREIASGLVDIHLSTQANRANEVMQVLTLVATIFIPLTFVVGVYGMNFAVMPELHWQWGYPVVMGVMGVVAVALTVWFRMKGWLGGKR